MGLGNRQARHETVGMRKNAMDTSVFHIFVEGQSVMTIDGIPGEVTAVLEGPHAGNEAYEVTLANGLGGGRYTASQLVAQGPAVASEYHTADRDYPELGTVLYDRPPIEREQRVASLLSTAMEDRYKGYLEKNNWSEDQDEEGHPRYTQAVPEREMSMHVTRVRRVPERWQHGVTDWHSGKYAPVIDTRDDKHLNSPEKAAYHFIPTRGQMAVLQLRNDFYGTDQHGYDPSGAPENSHRLLASTDEPMDPTSMMDPFAWADDDPRLEGPVDVSRQLPGKAPAGPEVDMPSYVDPEWRGRGRPFEAAADDEGGDGPIPPQQQDFEGDDGPPPCAYCGHPEFKPLPDTGRTSRAQCAQCGGVMYTNGGQWQPELIGDPANHPSGAADPASGGVGGAANATVMENRPARTHDDGERIASTQPEQPGKSLQISQDSNPITPEDHAKLEGILGPHIEHSPLPAHRRWPGLPENGVPTVGLHDLSELSHPRGITTTMYYDPDRHHIAIDHGFFHSPHAEMRGLWAERGARTPGGNSSQLEQGMVHEYGHSLHSQMTHDENSRMFHDLSHSIPDVTPFRADDNPDQWHEANRDAIGRHVSHTAAADQFELAAELYAEHSLAEHPSLAAEVASRHLRANDATSEHDDGNEHTASARIGMRHGASENHIHDLMTQFGYDHQTGEQSPDRLHTTTPTKRLGFAGYIEGEQATHSNHGYDRGPDWEDEQPVGYHGGVHYFRRFSGRDNDFAAWHKHGEVRQVPLHEGNIYATQGIVQDHGVAQYLKDPEQKWKAISANPRYPANEHPMFVKHQGDYYTIDGHHRTAAAMVRGDSHIKGIVYDADKHGIPTTSEEDPSFIPYDRKGELSKYASTTECSFTFANPSDALDHLVAHHDDGICLARQGEHHEAAVDASMQFEAMPSLKHEPPQGLTFDRYDPPPTDPYHHGELEKIRPGWSHHLMRSYMPGGVEGQDKHQSGSIMYSKSPEGYEPPTVAVHRMYVGEDERGQGIASAMQDELHHWHPNHVIDHGDRSDDGIGWWKQYQTPTEHPNAQLEEGDPLLGRTKAPERPGLTWPHEATVNDEIPWCAHLYHGNCTYPGDKLPNGTILGIPQDRGPCPWKKSAFQQAACPISAPGPMAVMMVTASGEMTHEGAWHFTATWADVRTKARRLRTEGNVHISIASHDGIGGEVQGDNGTYQTILSFIPGSYRVGSWNCDCEWAKYAFDRSPAFKRFEGRMCSHALALNYEAQSRGMFGKTPKPDKRRPKAAALGHLELDPEAIYPPDHALDLGHPPVVAVAQAALEQGADPAQALLEVMGFGVPHQAAQRFVHVAMGREDRSSVERDVIRTTANKQCPECHASIPDDAQECPECGARLQDDPIMHQAASQDAREHAHEFGEGVPDWHAGPLVNCDQCGGHGCGHCGGVGQVIDGPSTMNAIPDQNDDVGPMISEDGISVGDGLRQQGAKKKPAGPSVSGVALKAGDTGRVLMLQRGYEDAKDPARGLWEFPGGHVEPGDKTTLHGAVREWEEEVGQPFPEGASVHHTWTSPNGVYQGHVVMIPSERDIVMHDGRVVPNPDDPKGDKSEQAAWWDLDHARKNPALRPEVKANTPWNKLKAAGEDLQKTAATGDHMPLSDSDALERGLNDDSQFHVHQPSGAKYRLEQPVGGRGLVVAHHQLSTGGERKAGYLTWFPGKPRYDGANIDGGVIHKVYVSKQHRRRGLASAMLDFAREQNPDADIRHSKLLSEDAKAWSEKKAVFDINVDDMSYTADYSANDPLAGVEESFTQTSPQHSHSTNPASTGYATAYDPEGWNGEVPFGGRDDAPMASYEAVQHPVPCRPVYQPPLGSVLGEWGQGQANVVIERGATLHDFVEPALPSTDGDRQDPLHHLHHGRPHTDAQTMPYGYDDLSEFREDHPEAEDDSSLEDEVMPNSVTASANDPAVADIVARFQASAGGRMLDSGGAGGRPSGDGPSIAAAAQAFLQKSALKNFNFAEQQELINEGKRERTRARNMGDLRIEGTHYEALQSAFDADDLTSDDLFV